METGNFTTTGRKTEGNQSEKKIKNFFWPLRSSFIVFLKFIHVCILFATNKMFPVENLSKLLQGSEYLGILTFQTLELNMRKELTLDHLGTKYDVTIFCPVYPSSAEVRFPYG
jgi:hypothetical protein